MEVSTVVPAVFTKVVVSVFLVGEARPVTALKMDLRVELRLSMMSQRGVKLG
tara:strand:- start:904 stop:1059 length:156 start_codon:yes stop_codon:yes gene_type:complete